MDSARRSALVAGVAAALLVSCAASGSGDAPPPSHRLTPDEVTRLFTEWACPRRPDLASPLARLTPLAVDPESQPLSQGGRWIVFTSVGSVSFRESTRTFEPSEQAARSILGLQGTDSCRP